MGLRSGVQATSRSITTCLWSWRQQRHRELVARSSCTEAGLPEGSGGKLPPRSGVWRQISLLEAQREIATNWLDVYQHLPQRVSATGVPTVAPAPVQGYPSGVQIASITGGAAGWTRGNRPDDARSFVSISYRTSAGTPSTAQGLASTTADANGQVSWTWNIGSSTRPGTGTVIVTCNGASASSPIQIE